MQFETLPLLAGLTPPQKSWLSKHIVYRDYEPGETVVEEGTSGQDKLYIVVDGLASLLKDTGPARSTDKQFLEVDTRGPNGIFGEMPLLDGRPISVTVRAKTPLRVAIADLSAAHGPRARSVKNTIVTRLRDHASTRLRDLLAEKAGSIRLDGERQAYRNSIAACLITGLCLLSVYTLTLQFIPRFEKFLMVSFAASPIIILFFAAIYLTVMMRSGFPLAFFGVRFDNARQALTLSLAASALFIAVGVAIKGTLLLTVQRLEGVSLISFADVSVAGQPAMAAWFWVAAAVYLVLTPVQEFVARCGIQAPLYAFLEGHELRRQVSSIAVSNLVFAAAHAHISVQFALAAFIPGMFWGWIFARTNSWLAASVSHLLVGGAGIFLFGIEELVARLS
jgi:CRP-like cAMP-binding protein